MKKYLALATLFALPVMAFASVTIDPVSVSKGVATISGSTTAPETTSVSVDSNVVHYTTLASWTFSGIYGQGNHTVTANASDGSSATVSFTIFGGGNNPMNIPCGGTKGSCMESIASGEVVYTPRGVDGCEYAGGCIKNVPMPQAPKFIHLKYQEQGCNFFMGCVREL